MCASIVATAAVVALVTACSPQIVPGAYNCGPEEACPGGLVCTGSDNTCVFEPDVEPFNCPAEATSLATAVALPALDCVSVPFRASGCLGAGTSEYWYQFLTPPNCAAVAAKVSVVFPVAYEAIGVVLGDASGAMLAADEACPDVPENEESATAQRCVAMTLANDTGYTLDVIPAGGGDCGGDCAFNRFDIDVQLVTP